MDEKALGSRVSGLKKTGPSLNHGLQMPRFLQLQSTKQSYILTQELHAGEFLALRPYTFLSSVSLRRALRIYLLTYPRLTNSRLIADSVRTLQYVDLNKTL